MDTATILRSIAFGVGVLMLGTAAPLAWALDSSLDVSKYAHSVVWRIRDAARAGNIGPITQTSDGYLWLGTSSGLVRFDGVGPVDWQPPSGSALPDERIRSLLGARDGALWIGTQRGLAIWKDGRLDIPQALKGHRVNAIEEDADGTVWVGGTVEGQGFLCALRRDGTECYGADGSLGSVVLALHFDRSRSLWVAGRDRIWKWGTQPMVSYALPSDIVALRTMTSTHDGAIVVATRREVVRVVGGQVQKLALPAAAQDLHYIKALSDRGGSLWLGAADFGLVHLHEGRVDLFREADGLSNDHVLGLFEDKEGNIWVSTSHGLDRFTAMAAILYSRADGVTGRVGSVLAGRDGTIWASSSTGLFRLHDGKVSTILPFPSATLFEDHRGRIWVASPQKVVGHLDGDAFVPLPGIPQGFVDGFAEDSRRTLWIAHRSAGLLGIQADGTLKTYPWQSLGSGGAASALAIDPSDDAVWLALWSGAVVKVENGTVSTAIKLGDPSDFVGVRQLHVEEDGSVWAVSRLAVTRIKGGRMTRLGRSSGMPCEGAHWMLIDPHVVSMYTPCGLVDIVRTEVDAWGAAADQNKPAKVNVRLLDQWDGIVQPTNVSLAGVLEQTYPLFINPKAARSNDRIWLATSDGIAAVNPARFPVNDVAPAVHVESIVADRTAYEGSPAVSLPPLVRNLEIHYTAPSFVAPERVAFRYKLEGRDQEWQDAGNRRAAYYTDLAPGDYRFRVIAANNSGVWNRDGATLDLSIAPAYWQTMWFRIGCALAALVLLYALYRLRVRYLLRAFNMTLDARVNERMHIARELHDTLLQSFQGVLLRFQTALKLLPSSAIQSQDVLTSAIRQAADAITEGRDAVQGLRASTTETNDLPEAIRSLARELASEQIDDPRPNLRIEVQGQPRAMHPIVRDEVLRIAGEAMRNAMQHGRATQIEVDIRYDAKQVHLSVRDNGAGIDPNVLRAQGSDGHFGIRGMRERASLIGGKLKVSSALGVGTDLELTMPAARAYSPSRTHTRPMLHGADRGQETFIES